MADFSAAFPAQSISVADARHFVMNRLMEIDCDMSTVDAAALLVSELATNAVVHAATPFSVALVHDADVITIEVTDAGPGEPVAHEPGDESGRGLGIVAAIAEDWGVRRLAEGKAVFFRLPC